MFKLDKFLENKFGRNVMIKNMFILCSNKNISFKFIKNNIQYFDQDCWENLCLNKNIPISFFEENLEKVYWKALCLNKNISVEFLEKHYDKIFWKNLCRNSNVPLIFFEKNFSKICWKNLCLNKNVTQNFLENNLDKLNMRCWINICKNKNIPIKFLEINSNKFNDECWNNIWQHALFDYSFLKKNIKKLDIRVLLNKHFINYDENEKRKFIKIILKELNLSNLIQNYPKNRKYLLAEIFLYENSITLGSLINVNPKNFSIEFIKENFKMFDLATRINILIFNKNITIDFIENNLNNSSTNFVVLSNSLNKNIKKLDEEYFHSNYKNVLGEIKLFSYLPSGVNNIIPKGGICYREMIKEYDF